MLTAKDLFGKRRGTCVLDAVATVDPGSEGTGIARWDSLDRYAKEPAEPDWTDTYRPTDSTWSKRADDVADWFLAYPWHRWLVVIESPRVWLGNSKSTASAASGKIIKLAILVGQIKQVCINNGAREVVLVEPDQWKGQLPKRAMKKRVREALGRTYQEHEADAVAMGLAMQGHL